MKMFAIFSRAFCRNVLRHLKLYLERSPKLLIMTLQNFKVSNVSAMTLKIVWKQGFMIGVSQILFFKYAKICEKAYKYIVVLFLCRH